MPKTLYDMLTAIRIAGLGTGVDNVRTEIKPAAGGRMHLTLTHQASGPLVNAIAEADCTLRDDEAERFERSVAELVGEG